MDLEFPKTKEIYERLASNGWPTTVMYPAVNDSATHQYHSYLRSCINQQEWWFSAQDNNGRVH